MVRLTSVVVLDNFLLSTIFDTSMIVRDTSMLVRNGALKDKRFRLCPLILRL